MACVVGWEQSRGGLVWMWGGGLCFKFWFCFEFDILSYCCMRVLNIHILVKCWHGTISWDGINTWVYAKSWLNLNSLNIYVLWQFLRTYLLNVISTHQKMLERMIMNVSFYNIKFSQWMIIYATIFLKIFIKLNTCNHLQWRFCYSYFLLYYLILWV